MALTQITTNGITDGTITGTDLTTNVDFVDNQKLRLGTGNDLQIYHDGTDSRIANTTGNLIISDTNGNIALQAKTGEESVKCIPDAAVELYYDNDRKFRTLTSGCQIESTTGDTFLVIRAEEDNASSDAILRLSVQNASATSIIQFGDQDSSSIGQILYEHADNSMRFRTNSSEYWRITSAGHLENNNDTGRIKLGASDDLQIYHDGSKNYLKSAAFTNTEIWSDTFFVKSVTGAGEAIIKGSANGAVELYHDNSKKFETTSTGGKLTSSATTNGSIVFDVLSGIRGYVYADNANNIGFLDSDADWLVKGTKDAGVQLHYAGVSKFETVTGGATITGVCTATSFAGDGSSLSGINTDLVSDTSPQLGGDLDTNSFHINLDDDHAVRFGNSNDLQIYHNNSANTNEFTSPLSTNFRGKNLYFYTNHNNSSESAIMAYANAQVELYHDNNLKFATQSYGINLQDQGIQDCYGINSGGNQFRMIVPTGTSGGFRVLIHHADGSFAFNDSIANFYSNYIEFKKDATARDLDPEANNTYDLGNSSYRWRNIYTNDLNLSNEGSSNDVDGTWGSYTIQEGAEDLFLVNKRSGKKYKFNLTEVS